MQKPGNWDNTQAKTSGFTNLEPGPQILGIVAVVGTISKSNSEMLVLSLDIAHGEFKNHYSKMSNRLEKECYLKMYMSTSETGLPFFKGNIEIIEKCNKGYKWNWDENSLRGKFIGGNLRNEEYVNQTSGEVKEILKIDSFCTIEDIRDGKIKTLDTKKLPKQTSSYGESAFSGYNQASLPQEAVDTSFATGGFNDDGLPF